MSAIYILRTFLIYVMSSTVDRALSRVCRALLKQKNPKKECLHFTHIFDLCHVIYYRYIFIYILRTFLIYVMSSTVVRALSRVCRALLKQKDPEKECLHFTHIFDLCHVIYYRNIFIYIFILLVMSEFVCHFIYML